MKKYNISIISPYPVVCIGLEKILAKEKDLRISGVANNYTDAMQLVKKSNSDIVVVDISLRHRYGDFRLIKDINNKKPSLPILVYSICNEDLYAEMCLRMRAKGYIMMDESAEETVKAIRKVLEGGLYVSDRMSDKILHKFLGFKQEYVNPIDLLNPREFQIFNLLGQEFTAQEIATAFGVEVATVKTYFANIKTKLGFRRMHELHRYTRLEVDNKKKKPK